MEMTMMEKEIENQLNEMMIGFGFEKNSDGDYFVRKEYAVPLSIGCMAKVEYWIGVVVFHEEAKISFQATIYRRPNDESNVGKNYDETSLSIYEDSYLISKNYSYENVRKELKRKFDKMVNRTETRLKNIFGLECLD